MDPQRMVCHRVVREGALCSKLMADKTLDAPQTNWNNFFVEIGHSQTSLSGRIGGGNLEGS